MSKPNAIRVKLFAVYLVFVALSIAIMGSILTIQFVQGEHWSKRARNLTTKYRDVKAVRGNVYSRDGSLLATSVPIYEIRMDMQVEAMDDYDFYSHVDSLAWHLSRLFRDRSAQSYRSDLVAARKRGDRYYLVKRNVDYNDLQKVKTFPLFRRGRFKGGVIYEKQTVRVRPFGLLARRTIGYEVDGVTPVGLEGAYSEYLAGTRGSRLERRLAGGVWMPVENGHQIDPEDGLDLITTLDIHIQDVAENSLLKQLKKHDADHGTVVLMEVKTGEVKAIANLTRNADGSYAERYNYAVGESTEPGSTFKTMALLAALDEGKISPEDTVDAGNGVYQYYGVSMHDSKKGGYGRISVQRALEVSSNIGVSKVISEHYGKDPQSFVEKLRSMRLDEPLGLAIAGEGKPWVKSSIDNKDWSGISLTQMAIGYEVLLTPFQILAFYNAIANDGKLVKPRFADRLVRNGKVIRKFETEVLQEEVASARALEQVHSMLVGVVERGTAQNLKNTHFKIAGKTGTARIANNKYGYKYSSRYSYQASFVGYFPADDPLYSCIVVVNAPSKSVYYGNLVAGPIFREIADKVYSTSIEYHEELNDPTRAGANDVPISMHGNYADITRLFDAFGVSYQFQGESVEWVATRTGDTSVTVLPRETSRPGSNLVPNVMGMGLRDAIYLLENSGLEVEVEGMGMVKYQSIPPGRRIGGHEKIKIALS